MLPDRRPEKPEGSPRKVTPWPGQTGVGIDPASGMNRSGFHGLRRVMAPPHATRRAIPGCAATPHPGHSADLLLGFLCLFLRPLGGGGLFGGLLRSPRRSLRARAGRRTKNAVKPRGKRLRGSGVNCVARHRQLPTSCQNPPPRTAVATRNRPPSGLLPRDYAATHTPPCEVYCRIVR